jgi:hypothetical protein
MTSQHHLGSLALSPAATDGLGKATALALASTCVDLRVTQVASLTWGVHLDRRTSQRRTRGFLDGVASTAVIIDSKQSQLNCCEAGLPQAIADDHPTLSMMEELRRLERACSGRGFRVFAKCVGVAGWLRRG